MVVSARYAAGSRGQPTFLNLDQPYPDTIFTVLIWGTDRGKFAAPPEKVFDGKTVRVTGKITEYKGTPEVVVRDPAQIQVEEPPPGRPELQMADIAPGDRAVPSTQAEPPFVRGCRRALQVVGKMLAALGFLVLLVFLAAAFFWLVGFVMDLLAGRRGDR